MTEEVIAHAAPKAGAPRSDRTVDAAAQPTRESAPPARRAEPFTSAGRRGYILRRILVAADMLALVAAWGMVLGAMELIGRPPVVLHEIGLFALSAPLWLAVASSFSLYHLSDRRLEHSLADELGPGVLAVTVWSWIFLLVRAAALSGPVAVLPSIGMWAVALVTIPVFRAVARAIARRGRWYCQRVVVAGTEADVERVCRRIDRHPEFGLEIVSTLTFDDHGGDDDPLVRLAFEIDSDGRRDRSTAFLAAVRAEIAAQSASRVIVATTPGDLEQRSALLRALADARVHVDLVSADSDVLSTRSVIHHIEGLPVLTMPAVRSTRAARAVKRGIDLTAAVAGFIALAPLFVYCAIRIKLDSPGPVFFRQRRIGRGGTDFTVLKFRTMIEDADLRKPEIEPLNIHRDTDTPGMFKVPEDPRVTEFGRWLRRWSIDELPQLWNVLKGDMSLVGPRPLIPEEASLVTGAYEERFNMAPGITGRWQTLGRSDIGFEDMIKLDYTYVGGWSVAEDVLLLVRTAAVVLNRRGAY